MSHLPLLSCVLLLAATSGAQLPEVPGVQGAAATADDPTSADSVNAPPVLVPVNTPVKPAVVPPPVPDVDVGQPEVPDAVKTTPPAVEIVTPKVAFKLAEGGTPPKTPSGATDMKMLGSKCLIDQDCSSLNHTKCTDGMCLCLTGYIPSKRKTDVCLKVPSGLGDKCEEEHQCQQAVNGSECVDFKCSCPLNYVFNQNRCWEKQMLGGKCNVTAQCEDVSFAVCLQGVCTCEDPLIPSPINKCLPPAGTVYKAPCVEDIQCSHSFGDQGHCGSGECVCTVNHHFNGTKCALDKKLGEACLSDSDCDVSDVSNVEGSRTCVGNACTCATGFNSLPGEDICRSSGEELAVSLTWVLCIVLAKYYLA